MKTRYLLIAVLLSFCCFGESLKDVAASNVSAHVNGKVAVLPEGAFVESRDGFHQVHYNFTTEGHDAIFFELRKPLAEGTVFTAKVQGDGSGHSLFVVVKDNSGESFYFAGPVIDFKGWKNIGIKFKYPKINSGERYASIWGGDGNQTPDFPLQGIVVGLNDTPDTAIGSGMIVIKEIEVK